MDLLKGAVEHASPAPPALRSPRVVDSRGEAASASASTARTRRSALRMLGAGVTAAGNRAFFAARLAEAMALRAAVLPAETTGYRLHTAEGDGVPGWTGDRFGDVLVSQITAAGLEALRGEAYAALAARRYSPARRSVQANDRARRARRRGSWPAGDEAIAGEISTPGGRGALRRIRADVPGRAFAGGQKTGFYCDQRENRRLAERYAGGRSVLDLFSHTGAFALYALRGGATQVVCVESAARLIDAGRGHVTAERASLLASRSNG